MATMTETHDKTDPGYWADAIEEAAQRLAGLVARKPDRAFSATLRAIHSRLVDAVEQAEFGQ